MQKTGGIAQLGERLHGMQEVSGSIPLTSTKDKEVDGGARLVRGSRGKEKFDTRLFCPLRLEA